MCVPSSLVCAVNTFARPIGSPNDPWLELIESFNLWTIYWKKKPSKCCVNRVVFFLDRIDTINRKISRIIANSDEIIKLYQCMKREKKTQCVDNSQITYTQFLAANSKLCMWLITYRVRVLYISEWSFSHSTSLPQNKYKKNISKSAYRFNETSVKRLIWINRHCTEKREKEKKSDISEDLIQNNKSIYTYAHIESGKEKANENSDISRRILPRIFPVESILFY